MTDEAGNNGTLQPIVNTGTRLAPTKVSIPYISSNPAGCLFSAVASEFNVSFKKNRRVTHIALAFCQNKANIKTTTTDFSSGCPIFQLSNIRVEYAGIIYQKFYLQLDTIEKRNLSIKNK